MSALPRLFSAGGCTLNAKYLLPVLVRSATLVDGVFVILGVPMGRF